MAQDQVLSGSTRYQGHLTINLMCFNGCPDLLFVRIAQDECDLEVKNKMLEYLADLMEDDQDFFLGISQSCTCSYLWKKTWKDTQGLDRIRNAHAQINMEFQLQIMVRVAVSLVKS